MYISEFADGHRRRGMCKLRAPEKNEVSLYNVQRKKLNLNTVLHVGLQLHFASDWCIFGYGNALVISVISSRC